MSILEHILLFSFLFVFFYFWGIFIYNIKPKDEYRLLSLSPILAYSLIVGSRFGWGPDYLHYKDQLERPFLYKNDQIVFRWLNEFIRVIGFNYVGGYIVYSLIFIVCAFVLIRSYGVYSKYMYAFIIPASLLFLTNGIRQGVSFSFLLLGVFFLNKKRWIAFVFSLAICLLIHYANFVVAAILFSFILIKKPLSWKITIPIYIYLAFFFDVSKIGFIANYLSLINVDNHFQSYFDNADVWFGAEGAEEKYTQGIIPLLTSSAFYISVIYLGYWAIKIRPDKKIIYIYNAMTFGILLYKAVFLFEILRRIAEPLIIFYFIVLGYTFFIFTKLEKSPKLLKNIFFVKRLNQNPYKIIRIYRIGTVFIFLYLILYWGRFIFMNPEAVFFWNI
nr:EpsG family protein [uncultured Flavobacterium sp.]